MLDKVGYHFQSFFHSTEFTERYLHWILTLGTLLVSIWFISGKVYSEWNTISAARIAPDIPRLLISWLCITASTLLGAWEWTLLVNALGGRLKTITGMRIHLLSTLSKYIPGYIWPYFNKAHLAVRYGVPTNIAIFSVISEIVIIYMTGILILLLSLLINGLITETAKNTWAEVGCVFGFLIVTFVLGSLGTKYKIMVNWKGAVFVIIAVSLTWCLLGFGFYMLDTSIKPSSGNPWKLFAGLIIALLGGQLVLFAPMGVGVREAIFVAILDTNKPAWLIVMMALMLRFEMIFGEIVSTLFAVTCEVVKRKLNNSKG
jgi:hypothetical protein